MSSSKRVIGTLIGAAAMSTAIGLDIASHGVGVASTISTASSCFLGWMWLIDTLLNVTRTHTYTCQRRDCDVSIRVQNVTAEDQVRYQALATDHTKHGAQRA